MSLVGEFSPAFRQRGLSPEEREEILEWCRAQQAKIRDTFGDASAKARAMDRTFAALVEDGADLSLHMGKAFMAWALTYPSMLGAEDIKKCRCDHDGWTLEDESSNTWRPCARCNAELFMQYSSKAAPKPTVEQPLDLDDAPFQEEAFGPEQFPDESAF